MESKEHPLELEQIAFNAMIDELREKYLGHYVAILGGNLIGHNAHLGTLAVKVYKEHGYIPILIRQVTIKDVPEYCRSPRETH